MLDDDAQRPAAVALSGLAGVGKTELALELAYRRHREGRVAWWIAADDPAGIATGLSDLANAAGITQFERAEDTRAALWAELDRNPGWLIVFDNADEPRHLEPYLPTAQHGDVIITSHNPAWRRLARPIALPPLARPESIAFATGRSGDPDPAGANELAELLGDLPLALEQACAYIEQTGMSVPEYVRLFRERRATLLLRDTGGPGPTIATTWGLAFDRLRVRSPLAATVLETIAFLAPEAIDVAVLHPLTRDELDLQDAVGELLRLSLVDREGDQLRVHGLLQDVVRNRLPEPVRRQRFAAAAALCDAPCRGDDAGWTAWAAHLIVLAGHGKSLGAVPDRLVESLSALARRYAARALYPAATQVLEAALGLVRVYPAAEPSVVAGRLLCQLGEVCDAAGRLKEALALHHDAVAMLEGLVGPQDVALAHAFNRLGHVLNCADDIDGAIIAHRRALAALDAAGRTDLHPPVLTDLGYTLWAAGRLDRAGEALRAGRAMLERQGRRHERDWAHATAGLGMVEQDRGQLDEAAALQRTVIDAFTRVCGADHPDTAQAWDKLGYVLRLRGLVAESVAAHERAVRLLERVLGVDDFRVAMTLTNLGLAYADAGDPERAVSAQTRSRTIFLATLGPEHAHTLLATRRLAVALAVLDHPRRARSLIEEVLELVAARADGNDAEHGRIAADAAAVYAAIGDRELAASWRATAASTLTRALGPEHPEVRALGGAPPAERGLHGRCLPRHCLARSLQGPGWRVAVALPHHHSARGVPMPAAQAHVQRIRPAPRTGRAAARDLDTVELVAAARRRENAAWEELVARYGGMVRGVVASYRLQEADAADVMQMTWLRAFERLDSLRDPQRLGGWLATTASRECLALLRRTRCETPDETVAGDHVAGAPGPEAAVLVEETRGAVRAAVANLSGRRRRLVHALFYQPERDYVSLAGELGMPVGSIGPTRGRVLRSLRCTLEPAGFGGSTRARDELVTADAS